MQGMSLKFYVPTHHLLNANMRSPPLLFTLPKLVFCSRFQSALLRVGKESFTTRTSAHGNLGIMDKGRNNGAKLVAPD